MSTTPKLDYKERTLYPWSLGCLRNRQADPPQINRKILLIKVLDEKLREVCPNYGKRMREGKSVICATI